MTAVHVNAKIKLYRDSDNDNLLGFSVEAPAGTVKFYDSDGIDQTGTLDEAGIKALDSKGGNSPKEFNYDSNKDVKTKSAIKAFNDGAFGKTQSEQEKTAKKVLGAFDSQLVHRDPLTSAAADQNKAAGEEMTTGMKESGQNIITGVVCGAITVAFNRMAASKNKLVSTVGNVGMYVFGGITALIGLKETFKAARGATDLAPVQNLVNGVKRAVNGVLGDVNLGFLASDSNKAKAVIAPI